MSTSTHFITIFRIVRFWDLFLSCFLLNMQLDTGHHAILDYTSIPRRINASYRLLDLVCFKSKHILKVFGAAGQSMYLNTVKYM